MACVLFHDLGSAASRSPSKQGNLFCFFFFSLFFVILIWAVMWGCGVCLFVCFLCAFVCVCVFVCSLIVCVFVFYLLIAGVILGTGSMGPTSGQAASTPNPNTASTGGGSFSARDSTGNASATSTELATMFACLPEVII